MGLFKKNKLIKALQAEMRIRDFLLVSALNKQYALEKEIENLKRQSSVLTCAIAGLEEDNRRLRIENRMLWKENIRLLEQEGDEGTGGGSPPLQSEERKVYDEEDE